MAMTLPEIGGILWQILGRLAIVQSLASAMNPGPGGATLNQRLNALDDAVFALGAGIRSIQTREDIIIANQASALSASIAAVNTRQPATSPVILPTTPPAGYGTDYSLIGAEVWGYPMPGSGRAAADLQDDAGITAVNLATAGVSFMDRRSKFFRLSGTWNSLAGANSTDAGPIFPIANILPTDTLNTFLERESFWSGWTANDDTTQSVFQDPAHTDFLLTTTITEAEFELIRDAGALASPTNVPPVWPGVANVVLGTPVALASGLTISTPMDGVIVNISGVPPRANFYDFDGSPSYRNLGSLSFLTDDAEQEASQSLGFTSALYTPRTMFQAAGVKLRTVGGVSGTVTPWTRAP